MNSLLPWELTAAAEDTGSLILSAALGKKLLPMTAGPKSVEADTMRIQSSGGMLYRFIKQVTLTNSGDRALSPHMATSLQWKKPL